MKLIHHLKHLFIPHHGNDFKPHFFREAAIGIMLLASVFLLGFSFVNYLYMSRTEEGVRISSSVLVDITNTIRVANNTAPLYKNEKLEYAASLKGFDMAEKGYFAHYGPDGSSPWYWIQKTGYTFIVAGENLAVDFRSPYSVARGWLDSKPHRDNLLNASFKEIGIATVRGYHNGYPSIYVVQMFGTPGKALFESASTTLSVSLGTSPFSLDTAFIISPPAPSKVIASDAVAYSTWFERLLFSGPWYVDGIYKTLFFIIFVALIAMIVIEICRQHLLHIFYGVSLLFILSLFIYINQSFY